MLLGTPFMHIYKQRTVTINGLKTRENDLVIMTLVPQEVMKTIEPENEWWCRKFMKNDLNITYVYNSVVYN